MSTLAAFWMIKRVAVTVAIILLIGAGVLLVLQNGQQLTIDDLKKQIASVKATLTETTFMTNEAAQNKTTKQFTKVHAEELKDQLVQAHQSLTSNGVPPNLQNATQKQLSLIDTAIITLLILDTDTANTKGTADIHTHLQRLFEQETKLEKML